MAEYRRGRGPHFAAVPFELLDDPEADALTIATYAAIRSYADFGSPTGAEVGDAVACRRAGCSERAFRDRRERLRRMGWLEWEVVTTPTGRVNRYVVHSSRTDEGVRQEVPTGPAPHAGRVRQDVPTTESQIPRARTESSSVASQPAQAPRVENSRASPHGPEPIGAVLGRMAGLAPDETDTLHARRTALFAEVQRLAWLGRDPPVRAGEDQAAVRRHEAKILGELCAAMTDAEIMAALHGARAQLGPEVPYRLLLLMHRLPSGRTLAQVFAARGLGRESGALPAQVIRALREALEAA